MESVLLAFRLSADQFDPYDNRSSKVIGLKCKSKAVQEDFGMI